MAFDASPSWSGFNYQGKVALYYALKLINEEPTGEDFCNISLMLEDIEDFEIFRNGNRVSLHQVKAYSTSTYSKYSNALLAITIELFKNPKAIGKIHTWKEINPKPKFKKIDESIKDDLCSILDEYREANPKIGSTLLEKAVSEDAKKPKVSAILKAAFPRHTEAQLYEDLNSIYLEESNAISRLDVYLYEDNNRYCDLDVINSKIKSELLKALVNRNIYGGEDHLEKKFHYFLGMMDAYIIQRHKNIGSNEKIVIAFDKLVEVIESDHEDIGKDYLAYKFKDSFAHMIDQYMEDPEDYKEPEGDQPCNLKEVRKILLSLSPQELWAHYRVFCPHIVLNHENNTDNAFNADTQGTRYVLINILHEINFKRVSHDASNYKLVYRTASAPHKKYLPTTIANTASPNQIEKSITRNPNMSELLFEIENLIYKGEKSHTFSPNCMLHTEAPRAADEDSRSKRTEALNNITLVPIMSAKGELI